MSTLSSSKYPVISVLTALYDALGPTCEVGMRRDAKNYFLFANLGNKKATRIYSIEQVQHLINSIPTFDHELGIAIEYFKQQLGVK